MERLKSLKSIHHISFIAILEPFSNSSQIHQFRNHLNMDNALSNPNGKIWLFWNKEVDCKILENGEQVITCELNHVMNPNQFSVSFVYAKCKDHLRRPLWDSMLQQSNTSLPWCSLGDFNVITEPEEKLGGITYNMRKSLEFISIIEACGLQDLGYTGQKYTWSNQRGIYSRIWKRLDRGMVNDKWLEVMPQTTITHLPTVGSDHCPLLLEFTEHYQHHIKYFKFLNCWTDHPSFMETVNNCWNRNIEGNPMWCFHQKMKRLSTTLSRWSRLQFGDIYAKVKEYEDKVRQAEEDLILDNSEECRTNLHSINAEYIRYLKLEDSMLKQKTQLQWFKEGDKNSKYFHAIIRGRRRKLFIHRIQNDEGNWLQGDDDIARAACDHFQNIFTGEDTHIQEDALQCIPKLVTDDQNRDLQALPNLEELRTVVFSMNPNSAAGPDGMNGKFFQECWEIIKEDLFRVVLSFFNGQTLPKYYTHTCLVLLPKVSHPNKLSEFRPISLSNFTNKIISKLLCLRLAPTLPTLISPNQSGFVKNRSISENIMLAQEIIHQIKKPNVGGNVVIKLDMAKAYDRVSWSYICLILRRMGFGERFIDMVWRIMSHNWYSIIINGSRHGFFHSTRGLKQGDPLSPSLFILGAEVLSRLLNNLHQHPHYHGFFMAKRGPQINHLSFADDIIIFSSGRSQTLQLIMDTLHTYESTSGQLINRDKSHFMIPSNAFNSTVRRIKQVTGFRQKNSPITYLGCPLYIGRQKLIYYSDLIAKVVARITGWQAKILNYGGRATLVKHVIQALPIHLLSASSPPNLSYPHDEGGIGVRQISDVAKSFQYKQWWTFRTKTSLWGDFIKAKYCQRSNPITKKWDTGQSLIWKQLMKNKHKVEPHIQWQIQSGSCLFWWDNWLGVGPLAQFNTNSCRLNNTTVSAFMNNGQWNTDLLIQQAPPQLVSTILDIHINYQPLQQDQPCWTLNNNGEFSCSSAWNILRDKRPKTRINSNTWHQFIPFKCSFLVWRALRGKLPTNEKITSFGHSPSQCHCCYRPGLDTIDHIFVAGAFAKSTWSMFADSVGISKEYTPLRNLLMRWWTTKCRNEAHRLLLQALPIFICWNLWKNRCASKYGGKQSNLARVKFSVLKDTYLLLHSAFPYINWPNNWRDLVILVEQCYHDIKVFPVCWSKPTDHLVKLNTDGSALTNPGNIGGGGILRNASCDLMFAYAIPLGSGTNNQAEVILEVDSQLLLKWLQQEAKPPWSIKELLDKLNNIIHQFQEFSCNHTFREANSTADSLSKYSHKCSAPELYFNKQDLPKEARALMELDMLGMVRNRAFLFSVPISVICAGTYKPTTHHSTSGETNLGASGCSSSRMQQTTNGSLTNPTEATILWKAVRGGNTTGSCIRSPLYCNFSLHLTFLSNNILQQQAATFREHIQYNLQNYLPLCFSVCAITTGKPPSNLNQITREDPLFWEACSNTKLELHINLQQCLHSIHALSNSSIFAAALCANPVLLAFVCCVAAGTSTTGELFHQKLEISNRTPQKQSHYFHKEHGYSSLQISLAMRFGGFVLYRYPSCSSFIEPALIPKISHPQLHQCSWQTPFRNATKAAATWGYYEAEQSDCQPHSPLSTHLSNKSTNMHQTRNKYKFVGVVFLCRYSKKVNHLKTKTNKQPNYNGSNKELHKNMHQPFLFPQLFAPMLIDNAGSLMHTGYNFKVENSWHHKDTAAIIINHHLYLPYAAQQQNTVSTTEPNLQQQSCYHCNYRGSKGLGTRLQQPCLFASLANSGYQFSPQQLQGLWIL
ncbi:uncharacterized protein LOC129893019 [Solanum dulcamara]|uniref:uncharacterized protein LOC129893019 n=1 Tax=Solanum dulcamara TaxID=45834 RepID=UPI00248637A6|nr:uncharacterized protein LOC129893019 [Solanum dulcamara]